MSSQWGVLALILSLSAGSVAPAQTIQELERRIAETQAKADRVDSVARAHTLSLQPSLDVYSESLTIARGGVVIRHTPDMRKQVVTAARRADSLLEYQVGALIERVRSDTILLRLDTASRPRNMTVLEYHRGRPQPPVHVRGRMSVRDLEDNIVGSLGSEIASRRTPLVGWMGGPHVLTPTQRSVPTSWAGVRMAMITSASHVAHSCYDGNLKDCAAALQLVTVQDPATAWYDSAGRFEFVRSRKAEELRIDASETERCQQGSDRDCLSVMRRMFDFEQNRGDAVRTLGAPVDASVRWSLERFALDMGGRGANERMLNDTISVASALTVASGVPLDTLISRWRAAAEDDAGTSSSMSLRIALGCVGWVALMLFLALRSPRWR